MSQPKPATRKNLWLLPAALVLCVVLAFLLFKPGDQPRSPVASDGLTYVQRVNPLVADAGRLCEALATNPPPEQVWDMVAPLRERWNAARTAGGYEALKHDAFIVEFNRLFAALEAGRLVWNAVQAMPPETASVDEDRQTEVLFALLALHGVERADQLLARRGMTVDQLVTRTNLVAEISESYVRARAAGERSQAALRAISDGDGS